MSDFDSLKKAALGLDRLVPSFDLSNMRMPEIKIPPNPLVLAAEANYASEFHKRLLNWIAAFETSLDDAHEVGIRLVSFGQALVFHLTDIGYWNPSLMSFKGVTDAGDPVELIQHVTQISLLLMKLPRRDPTAPKRPIGFCAEADVSGDD
jgi:uncharacterized protein DUF6173